MQIPESERNNIGYLGDVDLYNLPESGQKLGRLDLYSGDYKYIDFSRLSVEMVYFNDAPAATDIDAVARFKSLDEIYINGNYFSPKLVKRAAELAKLSVVNCTPEIFDALPVSARGAEIDTNTYQGHPLDASKYEMTDFMGRLYGTDWMRQNYNNGRVNGDLDMNGAFEKFPDGFSDLIVNGKITGQYTKIKNLRDIPYSRDGIDDYQRGINLDASGLSLYQIFRKYYGDDWVNNNLDYSPETGRILVRVDMSVPQLKNMPAEFADISMHGRLFVNNNSVFEEIPKLPNADELVFYGRYGPEQKLLESVRASGIKRISFDSMNIPWDRQSNEYWGNDITYAGTVVMNVTPGGYGALERDADGLFHSYCGDMKIDGTLVVESINDNMDIIPAPNWCPAVHKLKLTGTNAELIKMYMSDINPAVRVLDLSACYNLDNFDELPVNKNITEIRPPYNADDKEQIKFMEMAAQKFPNAFFDIAMNDANLIGKNIRVRELRLENTDTKSMSDLPPVNMVYIGLMVASDILAGLSPDTTELSISNGNVSIDHIPKNSKLNKVSLNHRIRGNLSNLPAGITDLTLMEPPIDLSGLSHLKNLQKLYIRTSDEMGDYRVLDSLPPHLLDLMPESPHRDELIAIRDLPNNPRANKIRNAAKWLRDISGDTYKIHWSQYKFALAAFRTYIRQILGNHNFEKSPVEIMQYLQGEHNRTIIAELNKHSDKPTKFRDKLRGATAKLMNKPDKHPLMDNWDMRSDAIKTADANILNAPPVVKILRMYAAAKSGESKSPEIIVDNSR
jgi:hypothetical protein